MKGSCALISILITSRCRGRSKGREGRKEGGSGEIYVEESTWRRWNRDGEDDDGRERKSKKKEIKRRRADEQ